MCIPCLCIVLCCIWRRPCNLLATESRRPALVFLSVLVTSRKTTENHLFPWTTPKGIREQQCDIGKGAARSGTDCLVAATTGGEYRKDCCEACKLGLISGSMGMGCIFQNFAFGIPWDGAYRDCCLATHPFTTSPAHVTSPTALASSKDKKTTIIPTPALDSLCDLLPGELCAHICVPIPGSFRCLCHEGFTLMADGKSCQHDDLPNRCKLNNPCSHKCLDTGVAIECSCHPGYQLAIDERTCNDIDECVLGIHTCEADTQICRNEPGSYTCVNKDGSVSKPTKQQSGKSGTPNNFDAGKCPVGYEYNFQSQVCDDIDECLLKTADCGINSACQNTIGSFICVRKPVESCPPGYRFDDRLQSCADIDECSEGLDTCQQDKFFCVNTVGNYTCQSRRDSQCPAGYKYNKALSTCEDVDECMENLHGCVPDLETCRNTIGAYECDMKCDTGYQYSLAHTMCIDIDECKLQTHNCQRQCVNTIGSYSCVGELKLLCAAGYKPSSGDQECEDVDECKENIHSCDKNYEVCVNEIGSYRCDPISGAKEEGTTTSAPSIDENMLNNCESGYSYSYDRKACLDINECLTDLHNCSLKDGEECVNMPGSFMCKLSPKCPKNYIYNKLTMKCEDADECALGTHTCSIGEQCVNKQGGYWCNPVCRSGYMFDGTSSCIDIDECRTKLDNCNKHTERCVNIKGSFRCESLIQCQPGFRLTQSLQCEDVDECKENIHSCDKNYEVCVNEIGSYRCDPISGAKEEGTTTSAPSIDENMLNNCESGYSYSYDRKACLDINECLTDLHNCSLKDGEECVNMPGSFMCKLSPKCPKNYIYNKLTMKCEDADECALGTHTCSIGEQCVNKQGGYWCNPVCRSGYMFDGTSSCIDIDECRTKLDNCNKHTERCVNIEGSFRCESLIQCQPGFRLTQSLQCEDVDECKENIHSCDKNYEVCVNEIGSYRCDPISGAKEEGTTTSAPSIDENMLNNCESGYSYSYDRKACLDINECLTDLHNCSLKDGEECVNMPGSFMCKLSPKCPKNYIYNKLTMKCEDADECALGTHTCSIGEQCVNKQGGYWCNPVCRSGYMFDGTSSCIDIDECRTKLDNCNKHTERCVNIEGSFRCESLIQCQPGFRLTQSLQCEDVDECKENIHSCDKNYEVCVNEIGSYRCDPISGAKEEGTTTSAPSIDENMLNNCESGYSYSYDRKACLDINECLTDLHNCSLKDGEECVNMPGSFMCKLSPKCPKNYIYNKLTMKCEDADECALGTHTCSIGEQCVNKQGGYWCNPVCRSGYMFDGTSSCIDIDECRTKLDNCNKHTERCVNIEGSFRCESLIQCQPGFRLTQSLQCEDVDECKENIHSCDKNYEVCVNEIGSYRCDPISGAKEEGTTTSAPSIDENMLNNCESGYSYSYDRKACLDINECLTDLHNCSLKDGEECVNMPGSFMCKLSPKCPKNYIYNKLTMKCEDADECALGTHTCSIGEQCVNKQGGYWCNPVCRSGYMFDGTSSCIDIDECRTKLDNCNKHTERCVNIEGSFRCESLIQCQPGFRLTQSLQCEDEYEKHPNEVVKNEELTYNGANAASQCHLLVAVSIVLYLTVRLVGR